MADSSISQRLAALPDLPKPALCELWQQLFNKAPLPEIRKDLMLRVVAHRLQEQEFRGLSETTCRRLRQLTSSLAANPNAVLSSRPPVKPGTRLVRQWKEQVHVVEVESGGYAYKGTRYESLSEVARLITGTRWSGPLFFGLKNKQSTEGREAA